MGKRFALGENEGMRSCLPRIITWALIAGTAACGGRQDDVQAIRSVVDRYVRSVDNADTVLARQVWADDPGISFIHPLGHERGWEQIRGNVYDRIMGGMLAERRLSIRDLVVKPYGDVAVVDVEKGTLLRSIPMGEERDDTIRSVIAVSRGQLFIRTNNRLFCVGR